MNKNMKSGFRVIVFGFCIGLVGCIPHWEVDKPAGGKGYGIKSFWMKSWESSGVRCSLYYWDYQKREHFIWQPLFSSWILDNTNNVAMFGCLLNVQVSASKIETWNQVFAVEGAGPPVNITDDIIVLYTKASGTNIFNTIDEYAVGSLRHTSNTFQITISNIRKNSDHVVELRREAILNLIHEGKEKGLLLKDAKTGLPYYRRDLVAESRKLEK
jgi:hypothetical protein